MSDRYLWDGSGEPDPEVRRLEEALAVLRHRPTSPAFPQRFDDAPAPHTSGMRGLAAAAVVTALLGVGTSLLHEPRTASVTDAGRAQVVETDAHSSTRLDIGDLGTVEVFPRTRVRVLDRAGERYRIALDRGSLRAVIVAPPGDFLVETPSARAVDLGCIYTLRVDDHGAGLLTVEAGWVAFEYRGRESFVPAGAQCATRLRYGPGLPFYIDAPASLRKAAAAFDELEVAASPRRRDVLGALLADARPRDAITLWHILGRATADERALVYDRLSALSPPPPGVSREGIQRGDAAALDAWWDAFGLGDVGFWRTWKATWPDAPAPRSRGEHAAATGRR